MVGFLEVALDRGLLAQERHDDVAVLGRVLLVDDDVVALEDAGVLHRVAADLQDVGAPSPPASSGTETYSSMFSSASIGWPAATEPSSGRPSARTIPRTLSTALPTARSSNSIARGLEGSRRSSPIFSRFARCA